MPKHKLNNKIFRKKMKNDNFYVNDFENGKIKITLLLKKQED